MEHETVARDVSERGELVVRRRDGDVLELRVNGVFVMDTAETSTERRLAREALRDAAAPRRVLVGGLGLGYTVREVLTDSRVESVTVAEIEPAVVGWMRDGVLPGADVLADARVVVRVGDVREVTANLPDRSLDVVLLDVDNGPDFLVHDRNRAVYADPFLHECRRVLERGGIVAVWSSSWSDDLASRMRAVFGDCRGRPLPVTLQGRDERYWLLTSKMVP